MLHPDTQRRAQQELDRLLEGKRLPDIHDKEALPYVEALKREVMRWHPITPLGGQYHAAISYCLANSYAALVHKCIADDEYNGYHIPAGSLLFGNTW